jgi:hypothetical protein
MVFGCSQDGSFDQLKNGHEAETVVTIHEGKEAPDFYGESYN